MSYRHAIQLFAFLLIFNSCTQVDKSNKKGDETESDTTRTMQRETEESTGKNYRTDADSVILPAFTIELKLSDKAEQRLKDAHETVIVSAMFAGIPKDTTLKAYREWGQINVGEHQIELTDSRTAHFANVKIDKSIFESLANKDIEVLINVYSGRKSTDLNLLDVDALQDPISKVRMQPNVLTGKLIGE